MAKLAPPPYRPGMNLRAFLGQVWRDWFRDLSLELNNTGTSAPIDVTISGGVVQLTGRSAFRFITVDTEAGVATDDLTTILGGNPGERLTVQCAHNDRTVVMKDVDSLRLQADFSLNHTTDKLAMICISSGYWDETARASNGN